MPVSSDGKPLVVAGQGLMNAGTALAAVLSDLATKGMTGYRKVLAFVANEAALPASPTLDEAYIQSDTGALRVCTAAAIVDPPTPATWSLRCQVRQRW